MTDTQTPTTAVDSPEIWSIRDIAGFYRRSIRQANRIVRDASFPRPIRGDKHRWAASDVVAYAIHPGNAPEGVLRHEPSSARVVRIPRSAKLQPAGVRQ